MKLSMRSLLVATLLLTFSINAFAQSVPNAHKVSRTLQTRLEKAGKSTMEVSLFVRGDLNAIKREVEQRGGVYKYGYNNVAAIYLPLNEVYDLADAAKVTRIEDAPAVGQPLLDSVIPNNNILTIWNGTNPLLQGYDGEGVVIGFIDSGIDFTHDDFKNADGSTRIKYIWEQGVDSCGSPLVPQPYNYGIEWDSAQISARIATHTDKGELLCYGHGTHVAGIASGNGRSTGTHSGVAPKSDIIMVATPVPSGCAFGPANKCLFGPIDWLQTVADAANYIFEKADSMGKPCVINASLGTYDVRSSAGTRDGLDPAAQLISGMLNAKDGRVFVAAAGNHGATNNHHVRADITNDTAFTWFRYTSGCFPTCTGVCICDACRDTIMEFYVYSDTADFNGLQFRVGADMVDGPYGNRGLTPWDDISNRLNQNVKDTLWSVDSNQLAVVETYAEIVNGGTYHMRVLIDYDSLDYYYRFETKGTGAWDIWSSPCETWTSKLIKDSTQTPTVGQFPELVNYVYPDGNTLFSSWISHPDVITVGNYINKNTYTNVNGDTVVLGAETPGDKAPSSSIGPNRAGEQKPNIMSTGRVVFSTGDSAYLESLKIGNPDGVALGGFHLRNNGTSMASPVVAGLAALYLQKIWVEECKFASFSTVKDAIEMSAVSDGFTGTTPNSSWGYGKLDGFAALTHFPADTCDTTSVGVIDPDIWLNIFPNPNSGLFKFQYALTNTSADVTLHVLNVLGQLEQEHPLRKRSGQLNLKLERGIYFCQVRDSDRVLAVRKVVVY